MRVEIKYALFDDEIETKMPVRGSVHAAGFDLHSAYEAGTIVAGQTLKVRTNIVFEIPEGWVGKIYPRSGLGIKHGIRLANGTGIVDSDYRGEVIVALYMDHLPLISSAFRAYDVVKHERIAQIVFEPVHAVNLELVGRDELTDTKRGEGGFGSTGRSGLQTENSPSSG